MCLFVPLCKAIVTYFNMLTSLRIIYMAWRPYHRKDMLDKIQMRPTKLILGFRDLSYEERSKDVV